MTVKYLVCQVCGSRDVVTSSTESACLSGCWYREQLRYVATEDEDGGTA